MKTLASGSESRDCPSAEVWADFLLGLLPHEADQLSAHLDTCSHCFHLVENLPLPADPLIDSLRDQSDLPFEPNDSAYTQFRQRLDDLATTRVPSAPDQAFQTIGRFQILRELGTGGFGRVLLARDPSFPDRLVAIKVPKHDRPGEPALASRFEAEARAVSRLDHPNIISFTEAGTANGVPYLVSKYCEGPTLAAWIENRSDLLPERAVAGLLVAIAEGVRHAHSKGVLHRDITPRNILLDPCAEHDSNDHLGIGFVPKLTDFGLAKLFAVETGQMETGQTNDGSTMGTPEYMSPEQAAGRNRAIDERTDIHALGILLYQLLTGRVPFQGESVLSTLRQIEDDEPIPPTRLRPGLARDLDVICLKCLQKPREWRYQNVAALLEDLNRFLSNRPILAQPSGNLARTWKWSKRNPALASLICASALAIACFSVYASVSNRNLKKALGDYESSSRLVAQRDYANNIRRAWLAYEGGDKRISREYLDRCVPAKGSPPEADFRSWEWTYLDYLCRTTQEKLILRGHDQGVGDVKFSPDGKLLASAGLKDGSVILWDPQDGRRLATLDGHIGDVNRVAFSPDNRTLATGGDDRTIRLWDLATQECRLVLNDNPERVNELAYSPDGRLLISATFGQEIAIRDPETGKRISTLTGLGKHRALVFEPKSGGLLVSVEPPQLMRIDLTKPTAPKVVGVLHRESMADYLIQSLSLSNDEDLLAMGQVHLISLRHLTTHESSTSLPNQDASIRIVRLNQGSLHLATAGRDQIIRIFEPKSLDLFSARILNGHEASITSLDFSPDSVTLASGSLDGTVRLWLWQTASRHQAHRTEHRFQIQSMLPQDVFLKTYCFEGNRVAYCSKINEVRALDWPGLQEIATIPSPSGKPIQGTTLSNDGQFLAISEIAGELGIWDFKKNSYVSRLSVSIGRQSGVALCPDNQTLVFFNLQGIGEIWDWRLGKKLASVVGNKGRIVRLAFSPDGALLATADTNGGIIIQEARSAKPIALMNGSREGVTILEFSRDSRLLATSHRDGRISLWNTESGKLIETIFAPGNSIHWATFTPDSKSLIAMDHSDRLKVWQVESGLELMDLATQLGVAPIRVTPDGRTLIHITANKSESSFKVTTWSPDW